MSDAIFANLVTLLSEPLAFFVYSVFISQIAIISFFLPSKWRRFRKELFQEHPQSEYPKLYYQPLEVELSRQKLRKQIDYIFAAIATGALIYSLTYTASLQQTTKLMFLLCIFQLLPFLLSQYWGRKNSKLMQKMPQPQKRKVTLTSRKLTDFIRPSSLIIAIVMYITSITLGLYVYWDTIKANGMFDAKSWSLFALLLLNTLVFIYVLVLLNKTLFAKREDQNLSNQDRLFFIQKKLKQLVNSVILYSLFIITLFIFKVIGLGVVGALILTSIYMQIIMLIKVNPTKERDFSVYKAEAEAELD
jgi:hypothetical protein